MNRIQTKKQRKKIYKDTWSLDYAFTKWLEPRLKCYLKEGGKIVDLTYYSFTVDDETKTQEEWVNEMIVLCEYINDDSNFLEEEKAYKQKRLGKIWAEVMPAMWW